MIVNLKMIWMQQTTNYFRKNHKLIFMALSLLAGVLIGSLFMRNQQIVQTLSIETYFRQFVTARMTNSFLSLFLHTFISAVLYIAVAYCLGLFVFGCIPSVLLPAFRGLGIGAVVAYIYETYGIKGAAFVLFLVLPFTFCHSLLLLLGCREALTFSRAMFKSYAMGVPTVNLLQAFKKYQLRFLVLLILTAVIAVPDCLLSSIFIRVFGF